MKHRCAVLAIVGRPNVGKSTLLNSLVGSRVSITSRRPQTTRHRVTGIFSRPSLQLVFVDTPGIQDQHATALNRQLNKTAIAALADVDAVLWVIDAASLTAQDEAILRQIPSGLVAIAVLNKTDLITDENRRKKAYATGDRLAAMNRFTAVVPVSAQSGFQLEALISEIEKIAPEGPPMFSDDQVSDRSVRFMSGEIIREKIFRLTGDELPYETTVLTESFREEPSRNDAFRLHTHIVASIVVAKESQKAIVIGEKGQRIRRIGTEARQEISRLLGGPVTLELWVKVRRGWADDKAAIRAFGYE